VEDPQTGSAAATTALRAEFAEAVSKAWSDPCRDTDTCVAKLHRYSLTQRGKRMLKFAQLRSKAEIFAEIIHNYPGADDMCGGWEIEKFDFKPPSDRWMDSFKPLTTFELELKSTPGFDKFDVWIRGRTPKGDTKTAKVGTIANWWKLDGA